jgi:hypothetical protein
MRDIKAVFSVVVLIILSLLVIVPTVSAELVTTPEGVIITHYPDKFDGVGTVYAVEERGIVIDDMFVSFASQVRYMTPQSAYSSLGSFEKGQKVGYILDDEHKITKLCLFLEHGEG